MYVVLAIVFILLGFILIGTGALTANLMKSLSGSGLFAIGAGLAIYLLRRNR
jgi:hypothetical protein